MDSVDSEISFSNFSDILKEKKLYFINVFRERFYSVYMLILIIYVTS